MKDFHTLITVIENLSDDKIVEAVSCAVKTEAIIDGVLRILFAGTLSYIIYKTLKAMYE